MSDTTDNPAAALSPKMRELAEQNVAQAKKAYEQYTASAERMFNTMADAARLAWSGSRDFNQRMVAFADVNAKAGFDYAERFVKAKDAGEASALQQEYLRQAADRLGQQMRELNEIATKAAKESFEAAKPKP